MKTTAAVLWEVGTPWSVEEIELDAPGFQEVSVELRAAGMCHTDDHFVTGDMAWPMPVVGGHEGAGVVTEIGPGVTRLRGRRHRDPQLHADLRALPELFERTLAAVRSRTRRWAQVCRSPMAHRAIMHAART